MDPTNTPMPASTPVPATTPRSASPAPPLPDFSMVNFSGTTSSAVLLSPAMPEGKKPSVLHIGDPVKYNPDTYAAFSTQCDIIRPSTPERSRSEFMAALKERRWGDFSAIFRPFWGTGGEMGRWDEELIVLLPPTVRVFASAGAGFDWADVKLLGERGIIYCNSGLAAAEAVADFALAMIISTFRHIPWCMAAAASDSASEFKDCHGRATAVSHNLRGHVLGLIGLGNIGQRIAARCSHGFGMDVRYYDVERKSPEVEDSLKAAFRPTLESLLRESDCVVLCTPSGGKLITSETLSWFRPGARFVNIARGSLVDEEALADALEEERISTVAMDVHFDEPHIHPRLLKFANTRAMLACHNAGGTVETHKGFEELSMRNIMAVLADKDPVTPVNLQHLPKVCNKRQGYARLH